MIIKWIEKLLGNPKAKDLKRMNALVEKINAAEEKLQEISDEALQEHIESLKEKDFRSSQELMINMLATVKNVCRRLHGTEYLVFKKPTRWNMIPFDVQLVGAIALLEGKIAEMKTGEGKTLVAGMAASVAALAGKGVHVVTVNDYLAQRDAQLNTPLFAYMGISVGTVIHGKTADERKVSYRSNITYGTNNEFGFDYLRDNMATQEDEMVQRPLHYAIVDEVDSILIDEARTPLIISAPAGESTDKYREYAKLVDHLTENEHYNIDEKQKTAILTEKGIAKMEELLGVVNIYTEKGFEEVHHIEQALRAKACFKRDTDYIVSPDEQVVIVDEFTGRLMPGRRFSDGLHQALEAKEKVEVKQQSKTLATITFQNYFRLYDFLAGMTGTAETEEEEFGKIYALPVLPIPTNKPIQRKDHRDVVYKTEKGKFLAIAEKVKKSYEKGQPVLVGTASIEKSEMLSHIFNQLKIPHKVLNAKHHASEAEIISNAGQKGAITIATNMAGRGTDIKLGEGVVNVGGMLIIGSERHESRRIDNQLRGRSGRQGDPGETLFYVSLEDSLMRMFGSDRMLSMLNALNIPDDLPIENSIISAGIENAQKRVEGLNFDRRKHVLQYDDVMNKHRNIIYTKRKEILKSKSLHEEYQQMINEEVEKIVDLHTTGRQWHKWDVKEIYQNLTQFSRNDELISVEKLRSFEAVDDLLNFAKEYLTAGYFSKRVSFVNDPNLLNAQRIISLRSVDSYFIEHLQTMVRLKEQVALQGYGQRDPLMEYKKESFHLFKKLLADIRTSRLALFFHAHVQVQVEVPKPEDQKNIRTNNAEIKKGLKESEKGITKVRV